MTISIEVLSKYKHNGNVFVETGTYQGTTTQAALDLGFKKIYTIELADHFYQNAIRKFARSPQVVCVFGDSTTKIKEVLNELNESAVFWLDGHWSLGDTARGDNAVPLYEELDAIANHHIKTHTILIDDLRLMGNLNEPIQEWHSISIEETKRRCALINPNYKFSFENGYVPNDILVAQV